MNWEKKKILVTVKAYPEKSKRHGQVVCTIGITEEGEWIRLYPMPFESFIGTNKIKKYDYIEVECTKADEKLSRKESYKVKRGSIKIVDRHLSEGKVNGRVNWRERNRILLPQVSPSIEDLKRRFKEDKTSIGLIKPSNILEFYKKQDLQIYSDPKAFQQLLFGTYVPEVEKIPHIFGYKFKCFGCAERKTHKIQCEDWELLESYRSWGPKYKDPDLLWEKLHDKFYKKMIESNLHFYVGMFSQFPTWLIVGLYYPPMVVES